MKRIFALLAGLSVAGCLTASGAAQLVSLAGTWRFQLDRSDAGVAERWFARTLAEKVSLPGALAAQGIGDEISTNTPWTGGIVDRSWFTAPEYAA
jgi:beta-galactosidase/beta-glucuronidase